MFFHSKSYVWCPQEFQVDRTSGCIITLFRLMRQKAVNCWFYYIFFFFIWTYFWFTFYEKLVEMTYVKCLPLKISLFFFLFFMHMQFIHVYSLSSIDSCRQSFGQSSLFVVTLVSWVSYFFVVSRIEKSLLLCIRKERVIFVVTHLVSSVFFVILLFYCGRWCFVVNLITPCLINFYM